MHRLIGNTLLAQYMHAVIIYLHTYEVYDSDAFINIQMSPVGNLKVFDV